MAIRSRFGLLPAVASLFAAILACNASDVVPGATATGQAPTAAEQATRTPDLPSTEPPTVAPPTPVLEVPTEFSDEGRTVYLESEALRVGVDTRWGGAIREIWYQDVNLINNFDGGRLIGVAFYDSALPATTDHPNDTGWNPTPSDMHDHANEPLETTFQEGELYVRSRYLQWFPNDKGGGAGRPVETDVIVETWLRFFTDPRTIQLRYRVTNESDQGHGVHAQEFPFGYIRTPFNRFVSYVGDDPWTKDQVMIRDVPTDRDADMLTVSRERWAALVDEHDQGLLFWAPQSYPNFRHKYFHNPNLPENSSLYLLPRGYLEIKSQYTVEMQAYLLIGRWQDSRNRLYELREHFSHPDIMNPFGFVDSPSSGQTVAGDLRINGWAIDDRGLERIEVRMDGTTVGQARYGNPRHDAAETHPGMPNAPNYGYSYSLDTREFSNGTHRLEVIAVDRAGNTTTLLPGDFNIKIDN